MDEKKLDEELQKIWDESPVPHSDQAKQASWETFRSKTFAPKKKRLRTWHYYAVAASILLFLFIGTTLYFTNSPIQNGSFAGETVIANTTSEIKTVVLPDSSKVDLSPSSQIKYAANFVQNRKIEIEGEAYFKVTKDKKHPFQVFCSQTTTTVLGTSFIVRSNAKDNVIVELYEGRVQMNVKGLSQKWILKPGDKFIYADKIAEVEEFNRFTDFENEKLAGVGHYIEKNYGYKIIVPQEFANQRITVRINKKEDLKTIVQLISEMYDLDFEINEESKQISFH
ncbi:FecR family protein [Flavobacterium foetidum]|uniref:FecR family protein n=1 Tax=Flavobacterium foetidum TaxID=2026681 RepID=UPI001074BD01|nr:FecR family protein [Flavobacterium foetidum]KAF2508085.1 FecR family protein [Flavobacterium foetidum]